MRVSETLVNKKIIYSTKHIAKMIITETKTKEKTFTDQMLGSKESNKYAVETQGKTTSTM